LRVIAMVLLAPLAVRLMLSRRGGPRRSRTPPSARART
jgi:hypothetical protein